MLDKERALNVVQEKVACWVKDLKSPPIEELFSKIGFGKMLRSKLMLALLDEKISAEKWEKTLNLCAIVEMIQTASLLHDDVIDEATTRRKLPSINALFGNKNAIMLGDVFYSKAFFELSKMGEVIAQILSNAVLRLSRGEIEDVVISESFNTEKEKYWRILEDKTASFMQASLESVAILLGKNREVYASFGLNFGMAFQIIDDLLDVTQDAQTLGKPNFNDFKEGKTTLPYLLLYDKLAENERKLLISYFKSDKQEVIEWTKKKFAQYKIVEQTLEVAKTYSKKALKAIEGENNAILEELAHNVTQRVF
ncbi:polyprenyl synthetase family protein [Helicobacter cetorum]|uniref:Octaprenyl-diphosphate synthase n=1 Tax=Helicobacter cetorum (strain ATCC BAA-429 / MIT 00-7128) TaxID=182217 RepID=I0ENR6_HELC0|nr:polyprenyl synthetase family protein [Helicobacter cetorum]AFI04585.1 octaprenyl-diphosphate synthase [Helicobacter cetorum MIT 00-7128]